jgi:VanZ family protein
MVEGHTRLSMISGVNVRYFMLFLMLASLNVYLSTVPHLGQSIQNEVLNQVLRKSGHVGMFALLTWFLWMALPGRALKPYAKIVICGLVLTGVAFLSEYLQTFTAGRRGNVIGFGFDMLGILLALAALKWRGAMTSRGSG